VPEASCKDHSNSGTDRNLAGIMFRLSPATAIFKLVALSLALDMFWPSQVVSAEDLPDRVTVPMEVELNRPPRRGGAQTVGWQAW
jgi:FMN phosphatase YigB (HAD superfamily)